MNCSEHISSSINIANVQPLILDKEIAQNVFIPSSLKFITSEDKSNTKLDELEENKDSFITLPFLKYINRGAFGNVYKYGDTKHGYVAIKHIKDGGLEKDVINYIKRMKIDCNIIGVNNVEVDKQSLDKLTPNMYFVILEYCNGTLQDLFLNLSAFTTKNKYQIVSIATDYMKCLYDNKLCYTDMKPSNILVKCASAESSTVKLFVGDLGSIVACGSKGGATYPPFNVNDKTGLIASADQDSVVWGLLVLLIMLCVNDKKDISKVSTLFSYQSISKYSDDEFHDMLYTTLPLLLVYTKYGLIETIQMFMDNKHRNKIARTFENFIFVLKVFILYESSDIKFFPINVLIQTDTAYMKLYKTYINEQTQHKQLKQTKQMDENNELTALRQYKLHHDQSAARMYNEMTALRNLVHQKEQEIIKLKSQ